MSVFTKRFVFEHVDGTHYAVELNTNEGVGAVHVERHTGGYDTFASVTFSPEGARDHRDTYWASAPVYNGGKTMAEVIAEAKAAA
jgi:hypothetical protein